MVEKEILKIEKLSKKFDDKKVLDKIELSINEGEIIALLGSSGSGKSTLMNLITRVAKKDNGKILIQNKEISEYNNKEFAKKVGILRQNFDLIENLLVIHNVLIGKFNEWGFLKSLLSLLKPQDSEYARKALQEIGIEEKLFQKTALLSGGEKQRVAIARLLVQNPLLFLADEPVSSLDPVNSKRVLALITSLAKKQNKTLIASMHSLEYSKEYFDRIIGIKNGKIIFDVKTSDITDNMIQELYKVEEDTHYENNTSENNNYKNKDNIKKEGKNYEI